MLDNCLRKVRASMQDATHWVETIAARKNQFCRAGGDDRRKSQSTKLLLNALVTFDPQAAIQHYEQHLQKRFGGQPMPLKILGQTKAGWPATSGAKLFAKARASRTAHFCLSFRRGRLCAVRANQCTRIWFKNITDPTLYGPHVIRGILPIQLVVPVVCSSGSGFGDVSDCGCQWWRRIDPHSSIL